MGNPYFVDRPAPAGYKQTRISNNVRLQNMASSSNSHGGLLQTPPRSFSASSIQSHQFYPFIQLQQQPPLLPPPILLPHRSLPSPPPRSHSLNPKKSKSTRRKKLDSPPAVDRRAGSRVSTAAAKRVVSVGELEKLSGCLFAVSPPPSSLPLPKFSLRPTKVNCNVEASAGADDGAAAADDLRRLLSLH